MSERPGDPGVYVGRRRRVEHELLRLPEVGRTVAVGSGGALSRLPRDFGYGDDELCWLIVNGCGCGWGWTLDRGEIRGGMESRLACCGEVEAEMHHTAVHHLVGGGLSHEHHDAPGCTR